MLAKEIVFVPRLPWLVPSLNVDDFHYSRFGWSLFFHADDYTNLVSGLTQAQVVANLGSSTHECLRSLVRAHLVAGNSSA